MLALLLSVAILIYLSCIGLAIACLFARKISLVVLLTSPSIGLGVLIPVELTFSRAGLPVSDFGGWLVLGFGAAVALIFAIRRPVTPWRDFIPALPWIGIGGLLAGFPMLLYGFHWAANSNSDMGVYVSSASNLLHHGFFSVPTVGEIVKGTDIARSWWFWEILPPSRYGTDGLIALLAASVHFDTYLVYMPLGVAGFGALVMATGALCATKPMRPSMLVAMALVTIASPLMLFTVYQQILPQLLGQVALVSIVALVQLGDENGANIQRGVALGCVLDALAYIYPEISPVLVAAAAVTIPFALVKHAKELPAYFRSVGAVAVVAALAVVILQNIQLFTFIAGMQMLLSIVAAVSGTTGPGAINYYLTPSGFANLWGLLPFEYYREPVLSVCIVAGFFVFVFSLIAAFRSLLRSARFSDGMLVLLLLQFAYLVLKQNSYSSFKSAFVLQPFWIALVAMTAVSIAGAAARKFHIPPLWPRAALVAAFCAATAYTTYIYAGSSADFFSQSSSRYVELPAASKNDVYGTIDRIAARYRSAKSQPFRMDGLFNLATVRIIGIALRGHPLEIDDVDPLAHLTLAGGAHSRYLWITDVLGWPNGVRAQARARAAAYDKVFRCCDMLLFKKQVTVYVPPRPKSDRQAFALRPVARNEGLFLETGPQISVLNRSWVAQDFTIRAVPWHAVSHWLGFVDTSFGPAPFHAGKESALGGVEPDPYYPGGEFVVTLGKAMMLEVVNDSSPTVRLLLDISATFNPRPHVIIPSITVAGASRVTLSNIGVGSARIITPAIRPLSLFGRRYIILYFGHEVYKFVPERSWLMNLYGKNVDLDPRYFALYARNISIAPPLGDAPKQLADLPRDLKQPGLLYSGIYEDGWLGRKFSARLRSDFGDQVLHLRINVPPNSMQQVISVTIDGRAVAVLPVKPSTYLDMNFPWNTPGNHMVVVQATEIGEKVLVGDSRPTWGRLMQIGFQ